MSKDLSSCYGCHDKEKGERVLRNGVAHCIGCAYLVDRHDIDLEEFVGGNLREFVEAAIYREQVQEDSKTQQAAQEAIDEALERAVEETYN